MKKLTNQIVDRMDEILKGITSAYGATYEFLVDRMYPALKNDHELFKFSKKCFRKYFRKRQC